jgi:hypothetical protein
MKWVALMVVVMAAGGSSASAFTILAPDQIVPIEPWRCPQMRSWSADLIIVGKLVESRDPNNLLLRLPFREKAERWGIITYKIQVEKVIASRTTPADGSAPKALEVPAAGKTIAVLTSSAGASESQPIQFKGLPIRHNESPRVGRSYIFTLYRLADRTEFYLPANDGYWENADETHLKQVKEWLDVDKWPWGKVQDGFELALFAPASVEIQDWGLRFPVAVAMRNVSGKPLAVNLLPAKPLSLQATRDTGGTFMPIALPKASRSPAAADRDRVLAPGEVIFLDPSGTATEAMYLSLNLPEGAYVFVAAFSVEPTRLQMPRTWNGRILSPAVPVQVLPNNPRPPGAPGG